MEADFDSSATAVVVSVIIANYNCASYISDAIYSALNQSLRAIEVIVADDMSTDDSVARVKLIAEQDSRLRLIEGVRNGGPAAARNHALAVARGKWIAVLDSDDLLHPERLQYLIDAAEHDDVDIVADDLLYFEDSRAGSVRTLLQGKWSKAPFAVEIDDYIKSNSLFGRGPVLGYLKPIFRADLFADPSHRYNENLRIGEDFDLMLRMLANGARLHVYPELFYFYRRRTTSISHRLTEETISALKAADAQFRTDYPALTPSTVTALDRRLATIKRAQAFDQLVGALGRFSPLDMCRAIASMPSCILLLKFPIAARLRRLVASRAKETALGKDEDNIAFVSRQRIVGRTNGSSVYALSVVETLKAAGYRVHFVCPSPSLFGSWPFLRISDAMNIFETISIRGGVRVGKFIFAIDPRVGLRALLVFLQTALLRLKVLRNPIIQKAPYSIAVPLTRRDKLYLAQRLPSRADQLLFDYAFLTLTRPYALRPDASALVLMHDLFSIRALQFERLGQSDSVTQLDITTEMGLLGQADAVIAIQQQEADVVASYLTPGRVITAPMAADCVNEPSVGEDDRLLFVGSKAAPNVDAMHWFLSEVWPQIILLRPNACFDIVGNVCSALVDIPAAATLHGLVDDLTPFYRRAGVVVSPLRAGSGLKIKLIEALGFGKACVVTSATCLGVEQMILGAVKISDTADSMARDVAALLADRKDRSQLAAAALNIARATFGREKTYSSIVEFYKTRVK